jgi:uncharacterized membrane protein YfcA
MLFGLDAGELLAIAALLAAAGAITGVLAGLFGVGGGAITVPILYEVFRLIGTPEELRMPLAVGTSLAIIIPTSIRSSRAHFAKGTGDMAVVRAWALPVIAGVMLGAVIARVAEPSVFKIVFIAVASVNGIRLLAGNPRWRLGETLPGGWLLRLYGGIVGLLSALMGVGGGAISTLIQTLHGRDIRQAVSTSAAVGALIAVPGTLGYVWAGWGREGLPWGSLGFVSPLAFALVVPATLLTTGIGVRLAHELPKRRVELLFGSFLILVSLRFLWDLIAGSG